MDDDKKNRLIDLLLSSIRISEEKIKEITREDASLEKLVDEWEERGLIAFFDWHGKRFICLKKQGKDYFEILKFRGGYR